MKVVSEATIRRNAKACETASKPTCTCSCGGKLHGISHSEAWIAAAVVEAWRQVQRECTHTHCTKYRDGSWSCAICGAYGPGSVSAA